MPLRRRAGALALALGLNLLVLLALLGIQASKRIPKHFTDSLVVDLLPDSPSPAPRESAAVRPKATPPRIPRVKPPPQISQPIPRPLEMIELPREDYAAADIAGVPRAATGSRARSGTGPAIRRRSGAAPRPEPFCPGMGPAAKQCPSLAGYMATQTPPKGLGH